MFVQGRTGEFLDLRQFLDSTHLVCRGAQPDLRVDSCANCARDVRSGGAFFAVGTSRNPALEDDELCRSVRLAIQNGCKVVVADQPMEHLSVPQLIVENPAESYGKCVHELWGNPGKSLKIIGVSGTYGKTSTSYLIAGMLAEAGESIGLIGTLGVYDGEKMLPSGRTTPSPEELVRLFTRMRANGCTGVVLEISPESLRQFHLAGLELDALCVTNMCRDHRNRRGAIDCCETMEFRPRANPEAFRYLKKDGLAICNADDRVTSAVLPQIDHSVLTTGLRNSAEISGMLVERNSGEQTYLICAGTEAVPVQTKMIGEEHAYNVLTAAALGLGLGIDLRTAVRGIERVESIPGRMERIDCGQPFGVFVDCAPTPETLVGSLRTLRNVTAGRIYCVLGIEAERESDPEEARLRRRLVKGLQHWSDYTVLTADELRSPSGKIDAEDVGDLLERIPAHRIRVIATRPDAISWTLSHAEPEDGVLIVGRGCSEFQRFDGVDETRKPKVCDRAFAKQWLYENQPCLHDSFGPFF